MFEQVQPLARLLEVLRQHGPDPAPHAPGLRSTPSSSARKASPRATTSRRSSTTSTTTSPTRSWASSPAPPRPQVRKCLEDWNKGDNGILDLSRAYRLKRGTGWLIPPGVLHAPGSLCTYEPQWGSDVFGMFQSLVEGREVPWSLLVKDMPKDKHKDLDFIVGQLDWEKNVDTHFKEHNYLEPIVDKERSGKGYTDRWIVYGTVDGQQLFSAKELTLDPGASCTLQDPGASGWITVQGRGRMGTLDIANPGDDPLRRRNRRRSVHLARSRHGAASKSKTPAASRSSASATSARTCTKIPEVGDYQNNGPTRINHS